MERLLFPLRFYWFALTDVFAYPWLAQRTARLKFAVVLVLYLLFSLISTAHFSFSTLPRWQQDWQQTWEQLRQNWPSELQFRYENGTLNQMPATPLSLPYPAAFPKQTGWPESFVTLDMSADPPVEQTSLFFINRETVVTQTTSGGQRSFPLSEILGDTSWTVDKQRLENENTNAQQFFAELARLLQVIWFVSQWLGLLILRLLGLVLYAWIAQTLYTLMGIRLSYRQAYGLGVVLLLPAETIQLAINLMYSESLSLFWWAWLTLALLIGWLNRHQLRR